MQGFPKFPKKNILIFPIVKKILDVVAYPKKTELSKIAKRKKK